MHKWIFLGLFAFVLNSAGQVQAQTVAESLAAYERQDFRTAFKGFKKLAEQGDAFAQSILGWMYDNGEGVPKDGQQAVVWYRKAAEQGDASAQFNLGVKYDNGEGVPKNDKQAVMWYRKAAEQGNASAQFNLGVKYDNGEGVPKNDKQAVMWYRKAAEQGNASAQFNLGVKYDNGQGVTKDDLQAVAWYRKAAEQGNAPAQFNLGVMYANGQGVTKDDLQAVAWYRKAAEQGDSGAQYNLGLMYAFGRGVPKDEQSAYFWFLLASAKGVENAVHNREIVESLLSLEQRAAAQASARNWQPKTAAQTDTSNNGSRADKGGLNISPDDSSSASNQLDSTGSGFRIARNTIVTNYHVVDGCSSLRVNGTKARLRSGDERSDLALLDVRLPGAIANLRAQRAAVGESVAVAGYPLRGLLSGFNMTTGNVSSLSGIGGDTGYLQITAPVQPGNSGGPMLDSAGNLMGVVVSKLDVIRLAQINGDIAQNVNFAINVNVLRSFLDANDVEYVNGADKPITATAIADKAKGFTVLVECLK